MSESSPEKSQAPATLRIPVIAGTVLGVKVYRGYARLSDLARMSRADIYDAKRNPQGTQRDLSPKHAREAYTYVATEDVAFWPEIVLCVRVRRVVRFIQRDSRRHIGDLLIEMGKIRRSRRIAISRVDGNHRLYFADGHQEGMPAIDKYVSFCIAIGLSREEEIRLFRDINNNQRRMNTSHLDKISVRLSEEEQRKRANPALYIADRMTNGKKSPLYGLVYEGGRAIPGRFIPLRTLKTGISYMLSRPTRLNSLDDADAKLTVIENYFQAVKRWEPDAWENPKENLLLRGAGLWGVCFIGAEVIDRALGRGRFETNDMLRILKSGRKWDWSKKGDFQGLGGRGGAVKICERVAGELVDEGGVSVKDLFKKIMESR